MSVEERLAAMEQMLANMLAERRAAPSIAAEVSPGELLDFIQERTKVHDKELREISLALCKEPELGYHEVKAHARLATSLIQHGFSVSEVKGLPTAFIGTYKHGHGGRTHAFCCEYDALKGIGQACGHNLIAICGLGAGIILKEAMIKFDICGTVQVIGTPAEEGGGGKIALIKRDVFKSIDTCSMAHPGGGDPPMDSRVQGSCTIGGPGSLARSGITAEFFGRGAHAGAMPWAGINALDAAVASYNNISMLRQQLEPDTRVHGLILGNEDWNPNVIPNYAKMEYNVRAPTLKQVRALEKKVMACMRAGAEATGCSVEFDVPELGAYAELRNNGPMGKAFESVMSMAYSYKLDMTTKTTASTDFGNITLEVPSFHPGFVIPIVPGGGNHTKEFAAAAAKPEAHKLALNTMSGLIMVASKVLLEDDFFSKVKADFKKMKESI